MFGVARSGNSQRYYKALTVGYANRALAAGGDLRLREMHNVTIITPAFDNTELANEYYEVIVRVGTTDVGAGGVSVRYRLGRLANGAHIKQLSVPVAARYVELVGVGPSTEEEYVHVFWSDGPVETLTIT